VATNDFEVRIGEDVCRRPDGDSVSFSVQIEGSRCLLDPIDSAEPGFVHLFGELRLNHLDIVGVPSERVELSEMGKVDLAISGSGDHGFAKSVEDFGRSHAAGLLNEESRFNPLEPLTELEEGVLEFVITDQGFAPSMS
jgi:hypothetical protein